MNPDPSTSLNDEADEAIGVAASAWLARRDRGLTPTEVAEFERWKAADARHQAALTEMELVWCEMANLPAPVSKPNTAPALVAFESTPPETSSRARSSRWWPALIVPAAAALAVVFHIMPRSQTRSAPPSPTVAVTSVESFSTALGEHRRITLADGSQVEMNTGTVVEVAFSPGERRLRLGQGEAFFSVAQDPARPFIVDCGGAEGRALGTKFNVRQRTSGIELLVAEGRVQFGATQTTGIVVSAGQLAVQGLGSGAPNVTVVAADELERRLAWSEGRLVFKETPLGEVATEFNRYHRRKLIPCDAPTAAVLVAGSFQANNLEGLLRLLESGFEVTAEADGPERVVLALKR